MANIYEYQDYRRYLKDHLAEKKQSGGHLSQRAIQTKMGISSSGFLANVLAGRSNLTLSQCRKLATILKLNKSETQYFETMVLFTQARSIEDKADYFDRLLSSQQAKLTVLTPKQLSLFSRWHYAVIRELANFVDVRDYAALAKMIDPPLTAAEAKESVAQLLALGILKELPSGEIVQSDEIVSTGDEIRSFDIVQFQNATLDAARRALLRCPKAQRDISVLTFTVSEECFLQVKEELRQVRKRILNLVQRDRHPERVYQCSLNLFPVTAEQRKGS